MGNTEPVSYLPLVFSSVSGVVADAVTISLPHQLIKHKLFMSFPIKSLESRYMGMHLVGFEGCPLAALWYVNMKVFFVSLFFSKAANLFLFILLKCLINMSF